MKKLGTGNPRTRTYRRDPLTKEGCLAQVDGSRNDGLEGRGPYLTQVGETDDGLGAVDGATFREQENAQSCVPVLRRWC